MLRLWKARDIQSTASMCRLEATNWLIETYKGSNMKTSAMSVSQGIGHQIELCKKVKRTPPTQGKPWKDEHWCNRSRFPKAHLEPPYISAITGRPQWELTWLVRSCCWQIAPHFILQLSFLDRWPTNSPGAMPTLFTVLTILNSLLALEVAAYEVLYELQGATGTV